MTETAVMKDTDIDTDIIEDNRPKLDVHKALKLRLTKGLSYTEIGRLLGGYSRQAVHRALKSFNNLLDDPDGRAAFRSMKSEVLESAQLRLVSEIVDNSKLEKASVNNLAYAAGTLDQMIRLERNQSTSNVHSYSEFSNKITDLQEKEKRLMVSLGLADPEVDLSAMDLSEIDQEIERLSQNMDNLEDATG